MGRIRKNLVQQFVVVEQRIVEEQMLVERQLVVEQIVVVVVRQIVVVAIQRLGECECIRVNEGWLLALVVELEVRFLWRGNHKHQPHMTIGLEHLLVSTK